MSLDSRSGNLAIRTHCNLTDDTYVITVRNESLTKSYVGKDRDIGHQLYQSCVFALEMSSAAQHLDFKSPKVAER